MDRGACWEALPYPASVEGLAVGPAWASVLAPSNSGAVEAVKRCLRHCSRDLRWKVDMCEQLEAVAAEEGLRVREERKEREAAKREAELGEWKKKRREQLEKLIKVRPMFERRKAVEEERMLAKGEGLGGATPNPVSVAAIQELEAKKVGGDRRPCGPPGD
ncbi:unnamed protein product [Discosporangium mesarthrocarpum]